MDTTWPNEDPPETLTFLVEPIPSKDDGEEVQYSIKLPDDEEIEANFVNEQSCHIISSGPCFIIKNGIFQKSGNEVSSVLQVDNTKLSWAQPHIVIPFVTDSLIASSSSDKSIISLSELDKLKTKPLQHTVVFGLNKNIADRNVGQSNVLSSQMVVQDSDELWKDEEKSLNTDEGTWKGDNDNYTSSYINYLKCDNNWSGSMKGKLDWINIGKEIDKSFTLTVENNSTTSNKLLTNWNTGQIADNIAIQDPEEHIQQNVLHKTQQQEQSEVTQQVYTTDDDYRILNDNSDEVSLVQKIVPNTCLTQFETQAFEIPPEPVSNVIKPNVLSSTVAYNQDKECQLDNTNIYTQQNSVKMTDNLVYWETKKKENLVDTSSDQQNDTSINRNSCVIKDETNISELTEEHLPLKKKTKMKKTPSVTALLLDNNNIGTNGKAEISNFKKKLLHGKSNFVVASSDEDSDTPLSKLVKSEQKKTKHKKHSRKRNKRNVEATNDNLELDIKADILQPNLLTEFNIKDMSSYNCIRDVLEDLREKRWLNKKKYQTLVTGVSELKVDVLNEMKMKRASGSREYSTSLKMFAFMVHFFSQAAYVYLQSVFQNGLPTVAVIKEWRSVLNSTRPKVEVTSVNSVTITEDDLSD